MAGKSAGILMFRRKKEVEVLLVHPGGPFWQKKDEGSWSIPKGEYQADEDPLLAAQREFKEETGFTLAGEFLPLSTIKQKAGKEVTAWAVEGDLDADNIESNTFEMEWPPRSGKRKVFPEVDRAAWFNLENARLKINEKQAAFLDELTRYLNSSH